MLLEQPHASMSAPRLGGGMNVENRKGKNFANADGVRHVGIESGGLIATAALAHHAHGTHTHFSFGIANEPE